MVKKSEEKTVQTSKTTGKKGGLSVFTPETLGAMIGAAIGGLTGLALGNKNTRKQLLLAKDKAIKGAETVLENVEIDTKPPKKKA